MSFTWDEGTPPPDHRIGFWGWGRIVLRGGAVGTLVFSGLALLLAMRLVERPLFGMQRPITPYLTRFVCRNALRIMGLTFMREGRPFTGNGACVANHTSWLDIFVLNASDTIYFVSKAEVANWPGIGWLARATGTVFIARDRKDAQRQRLLLQDRLNHGHRLMFFPEGTSTDGRQVLPFKTTLFAAFMDDTLKSDLMVQPVSVSYIAPKGADPRFYGWWGDMSFGGHLLGTLAARRQGGVRVVYHDPLKVSDFPDRKALAAAAEAAVRQGHQPGKSGLAIPSDPG